MRYVRGQIRTVAQFGFSLAVALVLASPVRADPEPMLRHLALDLNTVPLSVTPINGDDSNRRILGDSRKFSLAPEKVSGFRSKTNWSRRDAERWSRSGWDLVIAHHPDGSWIRVHIGKLSRKGMPGVLALAARYARSFLVGYELDEIVNEVSLETYRGTAIYCGRIRDSHYRHSCSLAHVVLHGKETIRFYALIAAVKPEERDSLLHEVESILTSLQLHEP